MALLVIDLGSSSARTLLFDDNARLLPGAVVSRAHDFATDSQGGATTDAESLRGLVERCIDGILQHPAATKIRAVGMACFVGNWLGIGADGQACTPLITYADTRSHEQIPQLLEKLAGSARAYHQATGCRLHTAYLPAQYNWLCHRQPAAAARIQRISDFASYLYARWFGRGIPASLSVASWTGLLDGEHCRWHAGYARRLCGAGLLPKLPALADYDDAQSGLTDAYARRWQALRDAPFFLAVGDGAAANVGSGAVDARHIALTIGTTAALRAVTVAQPVPTGLWRYLVSADMPLLGGATSEGGNVYQWLWRDLLRETADLDARLAARPPAVHGLVVLPLLAGERAPGWQTDASGTIHGLRRSTNRLDLLQAHLEAVALRLSLIYAQLASPEARVLAGGGALNASKAWAQMLADAFDCPILLLAENEVTARGVALMMRQSLDGVALDAEPPQISRVAQPEPKRVAMMRAAREQQSELYRRLYG
ncbi:MAG: FGGY-family carbohydrate kinase [Chloroflexi bacterium]|nr:FGGY-family carbohydrate kinase [Chloroflexota bacterium]MCY4248057.1 FGGY-family carbohydrate kinase [Chloroflexota bacterium]